MSNYFRYLVVSCFLIFAHAQDFRATITGQITDPAKASVPGATVKATNIATGDSVETKTNSEGFYTLAYLNPGTYTVEVSATGFTTIKREGIILRVTGNGGLTNGFSRGTPYLRSLDGDFNPSAGLTGRYSLENPFPDGYLTPTGSTLGLLTNIGGGLSIDTRSLPTPRIHEYSFGIQSELPFGMVLEVSYSGNQAVHEPVGQQWGNVSRADFDKATADPAYLNTALPNPLMGILPAATGFGSSSSINAYDLRRPYPIFPGVFVNTNPVGKYRYDSLQVQMEKRVLGSRETGILTFVVSYTFSKAFEANHRLNDWNFAEPLIHELDYQDKPQSFAFSGVWDLPLGRGRRWLATDSKIANGIFGGWSFDWIYTYYSGYPVGKPDAVFTCGDYRVANQTFDQWLNNDKSCYSERPPYTLRSAEDRFPNIRQPSEPQLNVALQKTFKLSERFAFQLRGESFNVVNSPIMPGPNTDWRSPNFGRVTLSAAELPASDSVRWKNLFLT